LPAFILRSTSETFGSSCGSTPRTIAPPTRSPCSIASRSMNGAAPSTCALASAFLCAPAQSCMLPSMLLIVACDTMPRMRVRSSLSKPFMTEITTISAMTPTAIPAIDTSEMNEMK
jgi:hypothetical protein